MGSYTNTNLRSIFTENYPGTPLLVSAPGRVNLIGEHTDYNDGYVLPAAIDKVITLAIAPSGNDWCEIYSVDMDEKYRFNLKEFPLQHSGLQWPDYLLGCVTILHDAGYTMPGFHCVFQGNIPIGAGMSSSAALECGTLFALNTLFGFGLDTLDIVKYGQKAENEYVGVQCGIMDQFASVFGRKGQVFRLDCRSLDYQYFPVITDDIKIVLCDTQISHQLASSEYNIRREQCEQGVRVLQAEHPEIKSLRDVSMELLQNKRQQLDPVVYRRCEYVVEENRRVLDACQALEQGDFEQFGTLMYQSHAGLRDKYEVSCPELDLLVAATEDREEVWGARMMGGGFGGCTINLVQSDHVEKFKTHIRQSYSGQGRQPVQFYVTSIEQGVQLLRDTSEDEFLPDPMSNLGVPEKKAVSQQSG